jgi:hypothetical protein
MHDTLRMQGTPPNEVDVWYKALETRVQTSPLEKTPPDEDKHYEDKSCDRAVLFYCQLVNARK